MLVTVEQISKPNIRLRMVNDLSHKVAQLDQLQRTEAFNKQGDYGFIKESRKLRASLDTLSKLYQGDTEQLRRIKLIKGLLLDRDKQFLMYLQVRETLVNTESFSSEVQKLSELVGEQGRRTDSAVLTTESTTSTTTLAPEQPEKSRSFLSKLFGKKKAEVYKIINEEFKIKRDTLNAKAEDSIMVDINAALKNIEVEQRQKSAKFLKREAELNTASNVLTKQMLRILREVETEAVTQADLNNAQAKEVVGNGITQITSIIVVFLLITVVLLFLILTDITKSNRYRKALENAKDEAEYHGKAKQRFLSNMSHEIRTPLQSIIGYAELISEVEKPEKKDINAIYQSSIHLLQIVNEVLDYNRIISGEVRFVRQVFDLKKLLNEVVDVMHPLAEQKSLKLITQFDLEGVLCVKGDAFRLKQILFNLLGNAIKYTLKGEVKLAVSAKQQGEDLHFNFVIEDTGIGFAKKDISRIFNEFEQIDSLAHQAINQSGTGLGLPIVKSLIENQEGRIYVKSKEGKGTTFTIFLKYEHTSEKLQEVFTPEEYQFIHTGRVWIVDDDSLIRNLCELIFEKNKIPYRSFGTVGEVLKEQPGSDLKYVLLDMRLPEMTGLELFHLLKKKVDENVRFYAITAQVLPEEREIILSEGFDGIILKPFKAEDLLHIFEKVESQPEIPEYDFSSIEKMTFGDPHVFRKILTSFKEDCIADAEQLSIGMIKNEADECRLVVHRLAGRTAQMGAKKLAEKFRDLELAIVKYGLTEDLKKSIHVQLQKLNNLMLHIEQMEFQA
ncbi:ATP-binding response regulator [Pedobacter sp. MW01-1-1]|uniref:ATP-binding response regulator n=1 Tax=Pedobacter sp. MW01-1-1 TaxID=3383027 RepID=UPI003FEF4C1D